MNASVADSVGCNTTQCCQSSFGSLSFHISPAACICLFPRFPACNGSIADSEEQTTTLTSIQVVLSIIHVALLVFLCVIGASRVFYPPIGSSRLSVANVTILYCIIASFGRCIASRLLASAFHQLQAKPFT